MKRFFFCFALALLGYAVPAQTVADIPTRWASQVNPSAPLPEYPRPQMVRPSWMNLNGEWEYAILEKDSDYIKPEGKIVVPFAVESPLSGVRRRVEPENALWYARGFTVPRQWKGKRLLLHFGAVDWQAEVWVNGRKAGIHTGGYTAFSFDITDLLNKSGRQELKVKVLDASDQSWQPRGKQVASPQGIWYTPVTGIWQTVWLEAVPKAHIRSYLAGSDIDNGSVKVHVDADGLQAGDVVRVQLREGGIGYSAEHPSGAVVASADGADVVLPLAEPQLWSPANPYLYGLDISVLRKGKVIDKVSGYTAMRKISVITDTDTYSTRKGVPQGSLRLGLNNDILFQFGPLDQGWWPDGLYTAPTDEALRFDIEKTREWGFNMIHKHIKVEPARWYYWCDALGILVWQDMPSIADHGGKNNRMRPSEVAAGQTNSWGRGSFVGGTDCVVPEEWKQNYYKEWGEIIDFLKGFPCIAVWVPFNEAWGQFDTEKVVKFTKEKDPTRLVDEASGGNFHFSGDILDAHHYPEPRMTVFETSMVNVLGEYGGIGYPVEGHIWQPYGKNWGYAGLCKSKEEVLARYKMYAERLKVLIETGCAAAVYTQTTDVEVEVNGLMTYDRIEKVDASAIRAINQDVIGTPRWNDFSSSSSSMSREVKDRARALVSQMTLEEKCTLIHGAKGEGEYEDGFHIMPIPRLGIPAIRMADGPQGVRNKTNSTYYPCGLSLAASWNREVAGKVGEGIGLDARARGVAIMLCPGVNIYRTALCGRNFEYYGEDPYLASETALQYIKGIQGKGVMATIKHFALNNQEFDRHGVSSNADERTINEIYFPAFKKAVQEGNVACVMTSYNPVNGTHASENSWLIKDNLRAWGFEGIVMSDWTSTYSAIGCFDSGLDLEMPHGYVMNYENAKILLENGVIQESWIDEKCMHILQTVIAYGFLDNPVKDDSIPEDCDESRANALAAALEGPVLLKNTGILPFKSSQKTIVVLGPNADTVPYGGGSGRMDPIAGRNITLYAGLSKLGKGYRTELMDWKAPDYEKIRKAAAVVVAVGFNHDTERENFDRTYALPQQQNELICAVAEANPNTAVVVYSGGEVDVNPWIDKVGALVMAWYSGQEGGTALAQILSGKVSPSGRLPFTFWGSLEANPAYPNYGISKPYGQRATKQRYTKYPFIEYNEGIFLGYRGMEHFGVKPMFPLGYGLTYTDFTYSGLSIRKVQEGVEVSFTVSNNGKVGAAEVAQVYVSALDAKIPMPDMELKGFEKINIGPRQSRRVIILLPQCAFSHYDASSHSWVGDSGTYRISVGASALDIRLSEDIDISKR